MIHGRLQVIGIGSPAGDDRLGWEVATRLQAKLAAGIECDIWALDRPGSGLIEHLLKSDDCWLVDALWEPEAPGQYRQPTLEQLGRSQGTGTGSHGFGLADTLMLAERLGALPKRLELHCVTIASAAPLCEQLSPEVEAGVNELVQCLFQRLMGNTAPIADQPGR